MTDYLDLRLRLAPVPEHAADLAELAAGAMRDTSGALADYSPESLVELDELIDRLARDNSLQAVAETLFSLGCYLGEVIIRHAGGEWVDRETSRMRETSRWPLVIETSDGRGWNPIGKVFKRFELGSGESCAFLLEAAMRSAGKSGQRSEL